MQQARAMSVEALIHNATTTTGLLKQATAGKSEDTRAGTTVKTLQQLAELMERMSAELADRRISGARHTAALDRIAALKVRGAGELIEMGNWKKIAEELQSIAQSALEPEANR